MEKRNKIDPRLNPNADRTAIPADAIAQNMRDYLAAIGRKGGASGRGAAKARTSAQARRAAQARWKKDLSPPARA